MYKEVRVEKVLEIKPYARPPWVARPGVAIHEDGEQVRAIAEDVKPGKVDIYVDASVRNGRAGISVYATPSQARISKTVASSGQADAHFTEPNPNFRSIPPDVINEYVPLTAQPASSDIQL